MNEIIEKDNIKIENMIYEIRGKEVMLDSDLAKLYNCKNGTKEINQAVKNNIEKFQDRFSWKLTDEESENFLVKNFDQKIETRGGKYKNPRVFTEQGVAMLATIIKSKVATKVSIRIMDAFVAMRHYLIDNKDIYKSLNNINSKLLDHDKKFDYLFSKFERKEKLFLNGEVYDAYSEIVDIIKEAEKELIIIDAYADKNILDLIRKISCNVTIITKRNTKLTQNELDKYGKQYHNLKVIYNNDFHDRYIIIDKKEIYHIGTSINYAGNKIFSINKLEDSIIINTLINTVDRILCNY